jgi:A/G-specific adenine glycosylase
MTSPYAAAVLDWYAGHARDLPWRHASATPWSVMVSEFMLQQTPVARVLPAYEAWLDRWPSPDALASASQADAVRQWDRLGYPRRAIRLHSAAQIIVQRHGGQVPDSLAELRSLPGVGTYTAAAVAAFAYGQRHAVLDTNVRRVLARLVGGRDLALRTSASAAEIALAESLLPPAERRRAATWSVALMELGALICRAARPACETCPVAAHCAWRRSGYPAIETQRKAQRYEGSDRQARGRLLTALRAAPGPVPVRRLDACWPDDVQRARALAGLITDGLVTHYPDERIGLADDGA